MLSLSELGRRLATLTRMDLKAIELSELREFVAPMTSFVSLDGMILRAERDITVVRALSVTEPPLCKARMSYPPAERVSRFGRLNNIGQPWFYSTMALPAALYEIGARKGDLIAVSYWKVMEDLYCLLCGLDRERFEEMGSERNPENELPQVHRNRRARLVQNFLTREFTKVVPEGEEYLYKISVAVAEEMLRINKNSGGLKMDGIMYPAVAMKMNADNIALTPEAVEEKLRLDRVELLRITNREEDKYDADKVDVSRNRVDDGPIRWYGGVPEWSLEQGVYRFLVQDGEWVCYDKEGNTIDPAVSLKQVELKNHRGNSDS